MRKNRVDTRNDEKAHMPDFAEEFRREGTYPERVLDIGCGPCPEGEQFLAHGIHLTGVDQDGETIRNVQRRLPKGEFVTADAAIWLEATARRYDAILIRRPDLIFRSRNWHAVFQKIPSVLKPGGSVIVTTPGRSEAGMCAKWLRELADQVHLSETGFSEEAFLVRAEDFKETDKKKNDRTRLIQDLSWEEDQPAMVCDLRTGQCTAITDKEETENENEYTEE